MMDQQHTNPAENPRPAAPSRTGGGDELMDVIAEVEQQLGQLKSLSDERETARRQLKQREDEIARREQEVAEAARAVETSRSEARELEERLRAARAEFETSQEQARREQQELLSQSERRGAELEMQAATLGEREQRLASQATALSRERESLSQTAADLAQRERDLQQRADELAARLSQAQEAAGRLRDAEDQLRAQTDRSQSAEQRIAALESQLAQAASARDSLAARLAEQESAGNEHARQAEALRSQLDTAKAELKKAAAALHEQAGVAAQSAGLTAELQAGKARLAELEASARERAAAESQRHAELSKRLELSDAQLAETRSWLDKSAAEITTLRTRLEAAQAQAEKASLGEAAVSDLARTRQRRLRYVRTMLREQTQKIKAAGEALRARYEACEQLLAQREELATARNGMVEAQRRLDRLQGRAARTRSGALVFYIVGTLGVLAGLSWALAAHFARPLYAVRAVIAADTNSRAATPSQLQEWQRFHESLVLDPAIVEVAADRMQRRGMATLGAPGLLTERLRADLDHSSPTAGELVLELRGRGAERTARELETYATALASQANAARDRRADGVGTVILDARGGVSGPIDDRRPMIAAALFAALTFATFGAGGVLWRRMSRAKTRFEEEAQIDSILDEANWSDVRKKLESARPV